MTGQEQNALFRDRNGQELNLEEFSSRLRDFQHFGQAVRSFGLRGIVVPDTCDPKLSQALEGFAQWNKLTMEQLRDLLQTGAEFQIKLNKSLIQAGVSFNDGIIRFEAQQGASETRNQFLFFPQGGQMFKLARGNSGDYGIQGMGTFMNYFGPKPATPQSGSSMIFEVKGEFNQGIPIHGIVSYPNLNAQQMMEFWAKLVGSEGLTLSSDGCFKLHARLNFVRAGFDEERSSKRVAGEGNVIATGGGLRLDFRGPVRLDMRNGSLSLIRDRGATATVSGNGFENESNLK